MLRPGRWLRHRAFRIAPGLVSVDERGFRVDTPEVRERLERIGRTFLTGYHAGLDTDDVSELATRLDSVLLEWRGFAFEGAAMALAILDHVTPWKRTRVQALLDGPGEPHAYMVHVGVGWALARLGRRLERWLGPLDPLLRWLVIDGCGFHEGYFDWKRNLQDTSEATGAVGGVSDADHTSCAVSGQSSGTRAPGLASPGTPLLQYAVRAFDQGFGRSLWFVEGCDPDRIQSTIASLPTDRHADLWSGVGLACAYAGGTDRDGLASLRLAAGQHQAALAQGAAFAAKARTRAGNPTAETRLACGVLCAMSLEGAADVTDQALKGLEADGDEPAYEIWRRRIQARIAARRDDVRPSMFEPHAAVPSRIGDGVHA